MRRRSQRISDLDRRPYRHECRPCSEPTRRVRRTDEDGEQGAAAEVIIVNFDEASTMVEALRTGEVDYIRGVGADQFDALANEENIETVEGFSNGYTYLSFNTKGNSEGYTELTTGIESAIDGIRDLGESLRKMQQAIKDTDAALAGQ